MASERRRGLEELALRSLITRRWGADAALAARAVPFGSGAAVVVSAGETPFAAVFAETPVALGAAVDLAHRLGVAALHLALGIDAATVARRAEAFSVAVTVVDPGAGFARVEPAPVPPSVAMPAAFGPAAQRMVAAGLEPTWEHGVLTGEWLGLEVARVTLDVTSPGGVTVAVGVGHHDREATELLHPEGSTDAVLAAAVAAVAELRRPQAPPHPANGLAPERWLRAVVARHPDLIGMAEVVPGPPPAARGDLRSRSVAPAWGLRCGRDPVVVVCSVGVDPDVVAQAADARIQAPAWPGLPAHASPGHPAAGRPPPPALSGAPAVVIVVPEGDDHPLTRRVACLLRLPAQVVTVGRDWRRLGL